MDEIILAKDIEDCDSCPLKGYDCPGGWTSGGRGQPIESPCCSWNGDEEIYEGMYDYDPRDYSYLETDYSIKEQEAREKKERETRERAEIQLREASKYGNVKTKFVRLDEYWYCPHCHNWVWVYPWERGLIETASCSICGVNLAHSSYLD